LKRKVKHAISDNEPLFCIGFQLHDFSLSDLSINKKFTSLVYFNGSQFFGTADFSGAEFRGVAHFSDFYSKTKFQGEAIFSEAKFQGILFSDANFFEGRADFSRAKHIVREC
jgi:uncharacterized protein YjbI with pentapeptide repeats